MRFFTKTKKGFTLTELLIAMAVLAIIAAVTVPSMVTITNKKNFTNGLKKATLILKTVTSEIMADNSGTFAWTFTGPNTYANVFGQKMPFIKVCLANLNPGECFANSWKTLQGTNSWVDTNTLDRAILSNGMTVAFRTFSWTCTHAAYVRNAVNEGCGYLYIDTNGLKGPNVAGRDIFEFVLTKYNGILPSGAPGTASAVVLDRCSTTSVNFMNGQNCGAKVLTEGVMNY